MATMNIFDKEKKKEQTNSLASQVSHLYFLVILIFLKTSYINLLKLGDFSQNFGRKNTK